MAAFYLSTSASWEEHLWHLFRDRTTVRKSNAYICQPFTVVVSPSPQSSVSVPLQSSTHHLPSPSKKSSQPPTPRHNTVLLLQGSHSKPLSILEIAGSGRELHMHRIQHQHWTPVQTCILAPVASFNPNVCLQALCSLPFQTIAATQSTGCPSIT